MKQTHRALLGLALGVGLGLPVPAGSNPDTDLFLFTASVPPNVLLFIDNSRSMKEIEWHPAFDPSQSYTALCNKWNDDTVYEITSQKTETHCGKARTIWRPENPTLWTGRYLNWYFSSAADPYYNEIKTAKSIPKGCNPAGGANQLRDKYRRTRAQAAKLVLLDVICEAESKGVSFGLAEFRQPADAGNVDPNGGFVTVPVDKPTPRHASNLEAAVGNSSGSGASPLGESLFQSYTYFMSRDPANLPFGQDGVTRFPKYQYKSGANGAQTASPPGSPMEFVCQKNFVVMVTDGSPTRDDFDADPASTAVGFPVFTSLIGDYNPGAGDEPEVPGDVEESAWYLDDIARFMANNDCRPDMTGDQTIDVYTIGFGTDEGADDVLRRAADVGNGLYYHAQDGDQLSTALLAALNDIIEKAQSFANVTVPSTRTADGGDFYASFFIPSGRQAFWEGHLTAWRLDAQGAVRDSGGNCALIDPDPGECNSGPFKAEAVPFWDAASKVPAPDLRKLHTSKLLAGTPTRVAFDAALAPADLGIVPFTSPGTNDPSPNSGLYPLKGSTALNAAGLAKEVVAYGRGCELGTGVPGTDVSVPQACMVRDRLLGDIFHSSPIVVTRPKALIPEPSYFDFKTLHANRKRVIYAGANDGFLHAFDAGTWDALAVPPDYTAGTGAELFAFMPWQARRNIRRLPIDDPLARQLYVDGQLQVADAWFHPTPTTGSLPADKSASDWHTVLVGGLRQGGSQYFALDVTQPTLGSAPVYLWEFPREDDPNNVANPNSFLPYMGETWGQAILTRVRVRVGADDNGGKGYERWVAIVTGGYHASGDPNDSLNYAANARAGRSLFVLDLKTGKVLAQKRFDPAAPIGDAQRDMRYAIPSTPAVFDLDFDGFADVVYVGDLGGNLWKWVIKPVGEDRVNDASGALTQPSWSFRRVFQAPSGTVDGKTYYKSFFFPPAGTKLNGKVWLAFGSGERRDIQFLGKPSSPVENNRFYVMTDLDPLELAAAPLATVTEPDLQDLTASPGGAVLSGRGYYFRAADGEKFVTNVEIFAGFVIAASFTPIDDPQPCTAKGNSNLYVFKLASGAGHFEDGVGNSIRGISIGAGMPTDPQVSVGVGSGATTRIYVGKSGAEIESPDDDIPEPGDIRLLYWRERF